VKEQLTQTYTLRHTREGGNPEGAQAMRQADCYAVIHWIPAFAGMMPFFSLFWVSPWLHVS